MYTEIILFYASFIGIVGMVLLKQRELSTGNKSIISKIGAKSDDVFNAIFYAARKALSYMNRRTAITLVQWVAYHALLRIRRVYVEIKHRALMNPHSKKVIDAVRGRGQVQTHGASFYLRRISSDAK
ncbi:MAG: hypothetical protein WCV79_01490 [Candidatus Paceibacterota bacterium]|jgi:preprotein translocase subunit SecG